MAAAPATEEVMTPEARDLEGVDFGVKKSMRYHSRRRAFFERLDNITNWLVAVVGASAFAAITGEADHGKSWLPKILTAIITVIALADVIFACGTRSRIHQDLYRRFSDLAIEISGLEHPTARDINRLRAKRLTLEADEPHIIDALERWCWNEEAEARGAAPERLQELTKWQRLRAWLA
jgi:hypothetical protein